MENAPPINGTILTSLFYRRCPRFATEIPRYARLIPAEDAHCIQTMRVAEVFRTVRDRRKLARYGRGRGVGVGCDCGVFCGVVRGDGDAPGCGVSVAVAVAPPMAVSVGVAPGCPVG